MAKSEPTTVVVDDPIDRTGRLKAIGGSTSDAFNNALANAAISTLWLKNSGAEDRDRQITAAAAALVGIAPQDELEGMLAGQLIAANAAAMECYRRAMLSEQTFEGRKENLSQANKLSRTYVTLLEALNRHRGKSGQQKVTVEHVHVHAGGQAVVGAVQAGGGAPHPIESQPHAQAFTPRIMPRPMHLSPRCGARTRGGSPCRSPAMPNGRCRMHGGASPGAPRGEANGAYRHGRSTIEAIERRRELNAWVKAMRDLADQIS